MDDKTILIAIDHHEATVEVKKTFYKTIKEKTKGRSRSGRVKVFQCFGCPYYGLGACEQCIEATKRLGLE